ncbi:MAG TPA: ATP-binding protein [Candidatus Omnitrophota bacterium]|nr:hypothetical protein [Candidatus Omnitrophota bacterium]HPB67603.1 ATP-binding protein [Candidatus Omnitrophota bacterium]HQO57880.1 ATP-binding protein [Candidatus Omnitrophota bacterium]HQP11484.1 ATP-binding protein [Candidatus Omnitrophota bacterium]
MMDINQKIVSVFHVWREADSQRQIFGMNMPQTQGAIARLSRLLQEIFSFIPAVTLVKKGQTMNAFFKNPSTGRKEDMPVNIPSMLKIYELLKINSITIHKGLMEAELKKLFAGLCMSQKAAEEHGGLKGFLKKEGAVHIEVDQLKYKLLMDEDQLLALKEAGQKAVWMDAPIRKMEGRGQQEAFEAKWKDFIDGKLTIKEFEEQYRDFINEAMQDPRPLLKVVRQLMKKQADEETFIAKLEQKLFEAGFPQDVVAGFKKKLVQPKKVLISEEELARLKEIEKKYLGKGEGASPENVQVLQRKLADEKERSEAILHQTSQRGLILDREGRIVAVDTCAHNVLGMEEKELKGKKIGDILKGHHLLTMVSDWQNETDTNVPKEVKIQALNNETVEIIKDSAIVIENEDGRAIGVLSALQSVTRNEEFEKRKNDVLDVLGHDLRAPVSAIKQNFSMLITSTNLDGVLDTQQEKFLHNCKKNIERIENLIAKILDIRQFETGKILLKYSDVEMNKLIDDSVISVNKWVSDKNIYLDVRAEKLPVVSVDPDRIYQVITNLLSNACKFTPEAGTILVRGKLLMIQDKQFVEVSVKDSGIGIEKQDLVRVFTKYEQVSLNTPRGVSGLGLGLAICKAVVELHGGQIWADSEVGAGSTFTFRIPVLPNKGGNYES